MICSVRRETANVQQAAKRSRRRSWIDRSTVCYHSSASRLMLRFCRSMVANCEQDLTIAKATLQFQELLIKNALTKNLDDPILKAMPVHPTDSSTIQAGATTGSTEDSIALALRDRIELKESDIDLQNRNISRDAARNALLPTVSLTAYYGGTGLAGPPNPASHITSTAPMSWGGAVQHAFNNMAPDYYVGLSVGHSYPQSRSEVGSVLIGTGDGPGAASAAAVEEADSHRGAQRAVFPCAKQGAVEFATKSQRRSRSSARDRATRR